jgi:hypothetical protein
MNVFARRTIPNLRSSRILKNVNSIPQLGRMKLTNNTSNRSSTFGSFGQYRNFSSQTASENIDKVDDVAAVEDPKAESI